MSVPEALLDFFLETFVTFPVQGVPKEDWSMTIPASHDGGIPWSKVLNIPWKGIDVLNPC